MWTCYTFTEDSHNTGNFMPYSFRIMCGFFNVPQNCEHSRVVRRGLRFIVVIREDLKVLTICRCNYKGSTFSSVILRPWVLVRPESNSRPPAGQTVAQLTEPPVRGPVKLQQMLLPTKVQKSFFSNSECSCSLQFSSKMDTIFYRMLHVISC